MAASPGPVSPSRITAPPAGGQSVPRDSADLKTKVTTYVKTRFYIRTLPSARMSRAKLGDRHYLVTHTRVQSQAGV